TGPAPRGRDPVGAAGGRVLVRDRPRRAGLGAVIDPQPGANTRHAVADRGTGGGERAVEDHGDRVGVVPQVHQLVGRVAIVGVDGDEPGLEAREQCLDVRRAVVEVLRHLVLMDGAGVEQRAGDAVGTAVDLGPGAGQVALDDAARVGELIGDRLPDVGEAPPIGGETRRHGQATKVARAWDSTTLPLAVSAWTTASPSPVRHSLVMIVSPGYTRSAKRASNPPNRAGSPPQRPRRIARPTNPEVHRPCR